MKTLKILLVDDDLKNSMLLKRFIETEGYEVIYANNGKVGLEMYREVHPDLILLDINMPELDGFEMAKIIRQNDKRVIIFFLTDRTDKGVPSPWIFTERERLYSKAVLSRRTDC